MLTMTMPKFRFRIRTRGGMPLDNLTIGGRDEAEARRKLEQIYRGCDVLEVRPLTPAAVSPPAAAAQTAPSLPCHDQRAPLRERVIALSAANQELVAVAQTFPVRGGGAVAVAALPVALRAEPLASAQVETAPEAAGAEEDVSFESVLSLITR